MRMSDVLLRNAFALHQSGDLAGAAHLYSEILRANPRNFDATCMLALVHMQRGEKDEALRIAADASQFVSKSSRDFYNLGCLLQRLERHDDALGNFQSALSIRGDYFECWVHKGLSEFELTRYTDAIASFERA